MNKITIEADVKEVRLVTNANLEPEYGADGLVGMKPTIGSTAKLEAIGPIGLDGVTSIPIVVEYPIELLG